MPQRLRQLGTAAQLRDNVGQGLRNRMILNDLFRNLNRFQQMYVIADQDGQCTDETADVNRNQQPAENRDFDHLPIPPIPLPSAAPNPNGEPDPRKQQRQP